MAYNKFKLSQLKTTFELQIDEQSDQFAVCPPVAISTTLQQHLYKYVPLALANNTEKARSELIIMPILLELLRQLDDKISLFSGVEFTVDEKRGLKGVCDFLISLSTMQLLIEAPVLMIVEAKNDNIKKGYSQCIAEMIAAQLFNQQQNNAIDTIYGIVTTGDHWKFLSLVGKKVYIDRSDYYIKEIEKIMGILVSITKQEL